MGTSRLRAIRSFWAEVNTPARYPRGVDCGWHLYYWSLSYRRKLIRDLQLTPIGIAVIIAILIWGKRESLDSDLFFIGIFTVVSVWSVSRNYHMWKTLERGDRMGAGSPPTHENLSR